KLPVQTHQQFDCATLVCLVDFGYLFRVVCVSPRVVITHQLRHFIEKSGRRSPWPTLRIAAVAKQVQDRSNAREKTNRNSRLSTRGCSIPPARASTRCKFEERPTATRA